MKIVVGTNYIDPKDKDIVRVTKVINNEIVEFDVIKDPDHLWDSLGSNWFYVNTFLRDYVPCGELSDALYL